MALADSQHSKKIAQIAQEKLNELDVFLPGQWNTMFHKLVAFKDKYGHCELSQDKCIGKETKTNERRRKPFVTQDDKEDPEFQKLARWVGNQFVFYKYFQNGDKKHIKGHRIEALNKLGFIWDVKEHRWLEKYNQLKEYMRAHGNCETSSKANKDLHCWAVRQRREYARKKEGVPLSLSNERIRLLEEIDFDFKSTKPVNGGKKTKALTPDEFWVEKWA